MAGMSGENGGWTGGGHGIGGGEPGRDPGNQAGGGGGGNSGSGNSSGQSTQGKTDSTSQGRRDSATSSFGGFTDENTGLQNLADRSMQTVGIKDNPDEGKSELGKHGWKGAGFTSRADAATKGVSRGREMGKAAAGINLAGKIGSMVTASPAPSVAATGFNKAATASMTPSEERGFNEVQDRGLGLVGTAISNLAGMTLGPTAGQLASLGVSVANYGAQTSETNSLSNTSSAGRRETASNSFRNGSSPSNISLNGNNMGNINHNWTPPSYGFGDYDSHLKGLLS